MLEVSEIFGITVQGEGKKIGTPSIFIRFARCNLSCPGFKVEYKTNKEQVKYSCDSYYSVDKSFKSTWTKYNSYKDIVQETNKLILNCKPDIVITGGEPLLYWRNEEFQKLLQHYVENDFNITIETNGTIFVDFRKDYQKQILFSISAKLSNSGETLNKRINVQALNNIINNANSYLKFVVNKEFVSNATEEINSILKQISPCEVFVMPMGKNIDELNLNALSIINMAIENNFKYSDRLHIRLWDEKRGV